MAEFNFREYEKKWQQYWEQNQVFSSVISDKPKYYVLDMFPYPSGAGLHVGHPLGYIASDIVARYKRIKGFNVLHPMGFDSFGLPAEQYAVQTGQHPAITTEQNINRYKEQLRKLGFSYDWSREVRTSDPSYYKWTQWIFIQLFNHWYNKTSDKAEPISQLISTFEKEGNANINAVCDDDTILITATDWAKMSANEKQLFLLKYRLTYLSETMVNWCPALGTVLANEEVVNGVSERGGYPVERKKMQQWIMRITAYADKLLKGLDTLDWTDAMKEMQRNWIGKSFGAELTFKVVDSDIELTVFTTRVDTTFGVTYLSIAPEHELIPTLTSAEQKKAVEEYVTHTKNRSERDRMSDVKTVSGVFTGSYCINPFTNERIPIWIADYVLAGYGTGVVMAVPSSDERDFRFATHYKLPIIKVQEGAHTEIGQEDFDPKAGTMINSGFLNGLQVQEAIAKSFDYIEEKKIGKRKMNFRLRDSVFGRQRYWGEPIPVYYKEGVPFVFEEKDLPLQLPQIDKYLPTETGEPPLGRAKDFVKDGNPIELSTMPGWAGSSWYFLRYMDPQNKDRFVGEKEEKYWNQVDLYIGGSEHATGHLLYSRFWNLFLYDIGIVSSPEPFKKMINQGMIQGRSNFVYRFEHALYEGAKKHPPLFVSYNKMKAYTAKDQDPSVVEEIKNKILSITNLPSVPPITGFTTMHVDVNIVENDILNTEAFKKWRPDLNDAQFILEDGKYVCGAEVEKMSKSKYNVVNPDDIADKYGADTLRMYEMFLGPLEQFKPWNTNGIDGVYKFLRKVWHLFYDDNGKYLVNDAEPTKEEFKAVHKVIKKVEEDIERHAFNTSVSTFMICVNELSSLKCHKKAALEPLLIVLSPFAPHLTEELWSALGHKESISKAMYPVYNEDYIKESSFQYPIQINGKKKGELELSLTLTKEEIEKAASESDVVTKILAGQALKKVIAVPGRIINLVV